MMRSLKKPESAVVQPMSAVLQQVSVSEWVKGLLMAAFLAFFFYRSIYALIPMGIPAGVMVWWGRKKEVKTRNGELLAQFCECILSVGSAVKAGYAAENAFLESMKDMEMMYGRDAKILDELTQIKGGLVNHRPLEKLLQEMGQRTQIAEIREFGEIFAITKRNGGSLAEIIQLTAADIGRRQEAESEIRTLLASKVLEQKVMNLMPFLLVLYLQMTTPGYFDMFFHNVQGNVMMTLFLLWYMAAYGLSEYILWRTVG